MTTKKVSELPEDIKGWFERELKKAMKPVDEVVFYYSPARRRPSRLWKEWQAEWDWRDRRLKRVTGRMRKRGMSQADIECVLSGGRDKKSVI